MDLSLAGKHALVGGASRGIGRAAAERLAQLGAAVTVISRSAERLQEVVQSLDCNLDQQHGFIAADTGEPERLRELVAGLVKARPVQILVNNTGGPPDGPAYTARPEEFLRAFRSHLVCNQMLVQAALPGMRASGYGRIVNVISTSVKQPIPNLGVSNAIRGAVASWAKTLANELGPDGITVNNVLPGFTETDRLREVIAANAARAGLPEEAMAARMRESVPLRRFGRAGETANAIAFLASPAAAYINGINLPVDGGRTGSL
jgi:3-oxoacyl-[acyl-carrier protein] reductase